MGDVITCPSGLVGRIRGLRVREERILTDRKAARSGGQLEQILAACWQETIDSGPYDFDGAVDWSKVLQGDRFFTLLHVRALSYGPKYEFAVTCEQRACRARIEWELDLRELPVRSLSEESRETFLSGNRFETVLPAAGRKVAYRLLTGADERRMALLRRSANDRPITAMLSCRLESIEGVAPRDKAKFIEDLEMADVSFLLREVDRVDCGVDTTVEVECPECVATSEVELPLDRDFFFPATKSNSSRPSTSTSGGR